MHLHDAEHIHVPNLKAVALLSNTKMKLCIVGVPFMIPNHFLGYMALFINLNITCPRFLCVCVFDTVSEVLSIYTWEDTQISLGSSPIPMWMKLRHVRPLCLCCSSLWRLKKNSYFQVIFFSNAKSIFNFHKNNSTNKLI